MLKPITIRCHTGPDGALEIRVPTDVREADVDVVVVVHPVDPTADAPAGWPRGFFDKTFGCLSETGLERRPQGGYEARDAIP